MQRPFSDKRIIDCLKAAYGIKAETLTLLQLGADTHSLVYKVETPNHLTYFVKLKYGHSHEIIIAILELLNKSNVKQIIQPLFTIFNQAIHHIDGFTIIVYPFIGWENGFSHALNNEQWLLLGKVLRQIHEIDVPVSILQQLRREAFSSKWREIVRAFYNIINAKPIGDETAVKLLTFMRMNIIAIYRLVDRAEELAQKLKKEPLNFVLCHSDIHGGNVLVGSNNDIYIVDWDEPMMAPKERDLMFIGGGVGNVWNKPIEEALFYQGYGKTEINKTALSYYRHERIVEDIAIYTEQLLSTTTTSEIKQESYKHFISMFESNGVIDIALETGKGL